MKLRALNPHEINFELGGLIVEGKGCVRFFRHAAKKGQKI